MSIGTERRANLNGPLTWSLLCLAAVAVLLGVTLPPLVRAAITSGNLDNALDDRFAQLLEEHAQDLATYQDRFNGRSIFFEPPVRRVARTTPTPPPVRTGGSTAPPPPPPPPRKPPYSGPAVKGFAGGKVWFAGDMRIGLGEKQSGLEILEIDAPWKVVIKYGGWDYELPLFNRNEELFATPTSAARVGGLEVIETPATRPAGEDPASANGTRGEPDDDMTTDEVVEEDDDDDTTGAAPATRTAGSGGDDKDADAAEPRRSAVKKNDDTDA